LIEQSIEIIHAR